MTNNLIDITDEKWFKKEYNELLNQAQDLKLENKYESVYLKHFSSFFEAAIEKKQYNEADYLKIAADWIDLLQPNIKDHKVCRFILNLSRINASIRAIYEEKGIEKLLIQYIGHSELAYTEYNQVLISDYLYSFHYWEAVKTLDEGGIKPFIVYFEDKGLFTDPNLSWIVVSIIVNLINQKRFSTSELKLLKTTFPSEAISEKIK